MTIELRTRRYDETNTQTSVDAATEPGPEKVATKPGREPHRMPDWLPAPIGDVVSKIESARKTTVEEAADAAREAIRKAATKGADGAKLTPEERTRLKKAIGELGDKIEKLEKQLKASESSNPFYKEMKEAIEAMHMMHAGIEAFVETHGHPMGIVAAMAGSYKLYGAFQGMLEHRKAATELDPQKTWDPIFRAADDVMGAFTNLLHEGQDIAFEKPAVRVAG